MNVHCTYSRAWAYPLDINASLDKTYINIGNGQKFRL